MENALTRNAPFHLCIKETSTTSVPLLIMKFHGAQLKPMQMIIISMENGEIVILTAKQVIIVNRCNKSRDWFFSDKHA